MAVLVEAISVIVRADAIENKLGSGWNAFVSLVPNQTLCADGELVRVGFMHPDDTKAFVDSLNAKGLTYIEGGKAVDLVVVDQQRGPLASADWIEFGSVRLSQEGHTVSACRLKGSASKQVVMPPDWEFEGSISQTFAFSRSEKTIELTEIDRGLMEAKSPLWSGSMYLGRVQRKEDGDH